MERCDFIKAKKRIRFIDFAELVKSLGIVAVELVLIINQYGSDNLPGRLHFSQNFEN